MEQNLGFKQQLSQQQKLSYQMIQSINLLSIPTIELSEKIYEEVEKNPALEKFNRDRASFLTLTSSDVCSFTNAPKNAKKKDESSNKLLDWLSSLMPEDSDDTSALSPIELQYRKLSKELSLTQDEMQIV